MDEKLISHTAIFDLVEKKDDGSIGFDPVAVKSKDWITVIVEKDRQWLMETQLRYGLMSTCLEFPSGIVEHGETFAEAASRELAEETGLDIDSSLLTDLGCFAANPAFMTNRMHYFYVNLNDVSYKVCEKRFDQHEKIESFWMNRDDVIDRHMSSAVNDKLTNVSVFVAGAFELMRNKGIL